MARNAIRLLQSLILCLCCAISLAAPSTSPVVVNGAGHQLDAYLSRLEGLGFSGVVLVAKDDQVILHKGYGLANREQRIAYMSDTVFDIGSITKQFTAAAILRLEMAGKLSVADPISKYFFDVPADKRAITLHHLLTHSSGLRGGFGADYEVMPRETLVAKALASELQSTPGARYDYSNAGYSLLGAIVEKVSGQSYETFLQQQLFGRSGMAKTGYRLPKRQPAELAHGYELDTSWGTPLDKPWAGDGPWWNLRANGGLLSTVGDLYKWDRALQAQRILSAQAKTKYFAPHVAEDEDGTSHYGYGWVISKTPRHTKLIAHSGANGIFAADFRRYVDEKAVIIAASAQSDFQVFPVSEALGELLFGGEMALPPAMARLDAAALARYAGTYVLDTGGKLLVTPATSAANGLPALSIVPETREAFEPLMGIVSAQVRAELGNAEARLLSALQQTRQGIYEPLAEIYGASLEGLKERTPALIARYESRLGQFQRFELLGTVVRGERVTTWVRYVYARGAQVFEHAWQGAKIPFVRSVEGLGGSFFAADSEAGLFSYNPRTAALQRVGVEQAQDGTVTALVFNRPDGVWRATRQ